MGSRTYVLDADKIQRELDARGWNLAKLAERADFHPSTLTRVLRKGDRASLDTLLAIANALHVANHMSLVQGYVDPQGDVPVLREGDVDYFIIGIRKEGNVADATKEKDLDPIIGYLRSQPRVVYAAFVGFAPIQSFLINLKLSADVIITVVLRSLAEGKLAVLGITSVYLPIGFQEYIKLRFPDERRYFEIGNLFASWLFMGCRHGTTRLSLTYSADDTAIVTPFTSSPDKRPDHAYVVVGFHKEKDVTSATQQEDADPLLGELISPLVITYARFVKFTAMSGMLVEIELEIEAVIDIVIPQFLPRFVSRGLGTALYLPSSFVAYVTGKRFGAPSYELPQDVFRRWCALRYPERALVVTYTDDGAALLTPGAQEFMLSGV